MMIDCDSCAVRELQCGDCVMSVLLEITDISANLESSHDLSGATVTAISALAEGGLVPPLRFRSA